MESYENKIYKLYRNFLEDSERISKLIDVIIKNCFRKVDNKLQNQRLVKLKKNESKIF